MGRREGWAADHPVADKIRQAQFAPQRKLAADAAQQLGTVGAGNHYVDLFEDETGRVWVGVHFGSRGFGHRTAAGFLALAKGSSFTERVREGEMEAAPDVLHVDSALGQAYVAAMRLAGEYAYAGREVVVDQVLRILGAEVVGEPVHNHHNFAWPETHDGERLWVVRKGRRRRSPASAASSGRRWASRRSSSRERRRGRGRRGRFTRPSTAPGARCPARPPPGSRAGAGRAPTATATGRRGRASRRPRSAAGGAGRAARCGQVGLGKRWVREAGGAIDWPSVTAELRAKGIELRGANAEEAPGAYKRLSEVLAAHAGTVRLLHTLTPLGVAMAPGDTRDPYKD